MLEDNGDNVELRAVAVQKVMSVTAAVSTDNQIHIVRLDSKRAYITSNATSVQEIADYGRKNATHSPRIDVPVTCGEPLSTNEWKIAMEVSTLSWRQSPSAEAYLSSFAG